MKKTLVAGFLLGIIMPYLGLFLGLQVSSVLGNTFAWPLILVVWLTGTPIGAFATGLWFLAIGVSIIFWSGVLSFIYQRKALRAFFSSSKTKVR